MKMLALASSLAVMIMLAVPFTPIAATEPSAPAPIVVVPSAPRMTLPVGPFTAVRVVRSAATAATVPKVTITQAPAPLNVGQNRHSAFPGLAKLPGGDLRLVWREGTDHSRDGVIMRATSHDGGTSFGDVLVLRAGGDYRDPSVSVVYDAEYLTWFTAAPGAPAQGAFEMREWGNTFRMDAALPYAAMSAPIVRLPNGQIAGAFYGRQPGESIDTAFMAWQGASGNWTSNRIVNDIGAGVPHGEPYLVVDDPLIHLFYRDGPNGIGLRSSWDSGASGTWNAPMRIVDDATGRPSTVRTDGGVFVMVYRQASTGAARMLVSADHARTWADGGVLMASKGGLGMTYAAMVATGGDIFGVVGMEQPGGNGAIVSRLYGFRLATV